MKRDRRIQARGALFGRIAADALIHHMPRDLVRIQLPLKIIGITLTLAQTEPRAQAVAENEKNFATVR